VFISHSDFQLGDFLDTGHSKSQPSVGAPQDLGWDEVDRLPDIANNAGQNPATPDMNNAPRNYVPAVPSRPPAAPYQPQDQRWYVVGWLIRKRNREERLKLDVPPPYPYGQRDWLPAHVPAAPSQPSAGAPQDPGFDELAELLNGLNNAGRNLVTPDMNNGDLGFNELDELLNRLNNAERNLVTPDMNTGDLGFDELDELLNGLNNPGWNLVTPDMNNGDLGFGELDELLNRVNNAERNRATPNMNNAPRG